MSARILYTRIRLQGNSTSGILVAVQSTLLFQCVPDCIAHLTVWKIVMAYRNQLFS
jgi:hypothetical protein